MNRTRVWATVFMVFVGSAVVGACGSDADDGSDARRVEAPRERAADVRAGTAAQTAPACTLLDEKLATRVLGATLSKTLDRNSSPESQVPEPGATVVASQCEYEADDDQVLGLAVGTFVSPKAADDAFGMARLDTQFKEIKFEDVEGLGARRSEADGGPLPVPGLRPAYWVPDTPNHSRTENGKRFVFGELTVLDGRIFAVWTSPSDRAAAERTMEAVLTQ